MKNHFDISILAIQIILSLAVIFIAVFWMARICNSASVEDEILAYLKGTTETPSEYTILLKECSAHYAPDYPNARFYYAWMTDSDGDTVLKAVRYVSSDDIEAITVSW